MKTKKVTFNNYDGLELSALLELPVDMKPHNYVVFAHCFTCGKSLRAVKNIAAALTAMGFAVLRFDFTGLGESEGDFSETSFSSNISDLKSACRFLSEEYREPTMLIGHSLGGAAVVFAAAEMPNIKAVVTIAAPAEPAHVKKLLQDDIEEIKRKGKASVSIGGRPFEISKDFLDDLQNNKLEEVAHDLDAALLVLHSPFDKIVGIDNAATLFKAAKHPKSFVTLGEADHLLSEIKDSTYAGKVIASWAEHYLDMQTKEAEDLKTNHQIVASTSDSSMTTQILAGKHHIIADEPVDANGNDLGPTPYELLSSALGACTAMTLHFYARRKKWDLQNAKVHVTHGKEHSQDCEKCENDKSAKIDVMKRYIEVEGDLTHEQRTKLKEIANKCPVHRTLTSDIEIRTELK